MEGGGMSNVTATDLRLKPKLTDHMADKAWYWRSQVGDGGFTYDTSPNEAAAELEGAHMAFLSLIAAIEREGYEVLHDLADHSFSVRRKQPE